MVSLANLIYVTKKSSLLEKKREIDTLKHHTLLISQKGARKDCNAIYQRLNDYCDVTLLLKVLILLKESTVSLKNPQLNS